MIGVGGHAAQTKQNQRFQRADILVVVPEGAHIIVVVFATGRRTVCASVGIQRLFGVNFCDERGECFIVEINICDGGEQPFQHKQIGAACRLVAAHRAGKTDERSRQIILKVGGVGLFAAHTCIAGATCTSGCLFTLEAKHFCVHRFSSSSLAHLCLSQTRRMFLLGLCSAINGLNAVPFVTRRWHSILYLGLV
ncbi:hypothetical protein SDC9_130587 [bioreactor metagenome]|uniref:Uncharacterized protein n=1 Tax=bioreactor metagenome TaxID=1076179 RepID=A0A645D345_9ZZZZ